MSEVAAVSVWRPGEPWPTDAAFRAAGFVRFSAKVEGATFVNCWARGDFFEDDEPVERILAEYATGVPVVTVAPPIDREPD